MFRNLLTAAAVLLFATSAGAVEKIEPDAKVAALVKQTLAALQLPNDAARLKALLPLVHRSLKTADGGDLARTVKDFSFKKASRGAGNYLPEITEVHKGAVSTVGFKETAQRCRRDKYFVKPKDPDGKGFRAAPIHVCVPEDGSAPTILDFGSLN